MRDDDRQWEPRNPRATADVDNVLCVPDLRKLDGNDRVRNMVENNPSGIANGCRCVLVVSEQPGESGQLRAGIRRERKPLGKRVDPIVHGRSGRRGQVVRPQLILSLGPGRTGALPLDKARVVFTHRAEPLSRRRVDLLQTGRLQMRETSTTSAVPRAIH